MCASEPAPNAKQGLSHSAAHLISAVTLTVLLVVAALCVGRGQIAFTLFCIAILYAGRRIGWRLSRASLYLHPLPFVIFECFFWGALIAYLVHTLIAAHHPHWLLRWVFGYGIGFYVSSPNYGLLLESSIPDHAFAWHYTIMYVPPAVFVLCSIALAYI
jgi:hypothetical protein